MLSRKARRFIVFFVCLYLVYIGLNSINKAAILIRDKQQEDDVIRSLNTDDDFDEPIQAGGLHKLRQIQAEHREEQQQEQQQPDTMMSDNPANDELQKLHQNPIPDHPEQENLIADYSFSFEKLFDIYMKHFPQIGPITKRENDPVQLKAINVDDDIEDQNFILSEEHLSNHLQIEEYQFHELREKHRQLVEALNKLELPKAGEAYEAGTAGIVMFGDSEPRLLLCLAVVDILKNHTHSILPIEIMTYKEQDQKFCSRTLQTYPGVKCTPMLHNFNDAMKKTWVFNDPNWFKSLSILNSQFEKVLYIDATAIPIMDPKEFFIDHPFKTTGLVVWPDYWRRMTSPHYYKVIDKTIDTFRTRHVKNEFVTTLETNIENAFFNKMPLHDRGGTIQDGSTANEILLIDKSIHWKTLLLSLYYNINGESFYYPLLSNFAPNIGIPEKETIVAAANFYNVDYYQLKKPCQVAGSYFNGDFHGIGIKQYDPLKDYRNLIIYKRKRGDFNQIMNNNNDKLSFVILNNPNLEPWNLLQNHNSLKDTDDRSQIRLLGEDLQDIGFDLELYVFEFYKQLICEDKLQLSFVKDTKKLCKFLNLHLTYLKSTVADVKIDK